MIILGLTGSIGMGKTTASDSFRRFGIPVHNADWAAHDMMRKGGEAVRSMAAMFPAAICKGGVDRQIIAQEVFADAKALDRVEKILHPLVRLRERRFLNHCARQCRSMVVLDVPLLFETNGERRCDGVITVSAPKIVQRQRVMGRPGMSLERFHAILARQLSDEEKRKRSDFIVLTGIGRHFSFLQIQKIVRLTKRWKGKHWPQGQIIKGLE